VTTTTVPLPPKPGTIVAFLSRRRRPACKRCACVVVTAQYTAVSAQNSSDYAKTLKLASLKYYNKQTSAVRQASEESACFHSSATIKTCKRIYGIFHNYRPQRWRQVNQSQFIDGETNFAFSNASSVL